MTACIFLTRGSKGLWAGFMTTCEGDTVEQYTADAPNVGGVMLALTKTLMAKANKERRILTPDDTPPPLTEV